MNPLPYKGMRRGRKKGSGAALMLTIEDWYFACETYDNLAIKMGQRAFLRSNLSSHHFTKCTQSQAQSFGRMLKKYRSGELQPLKVKRERSRKYIELEDRLVQYLKVRAESYKRDKYGISWAILQEKLLSWAEKMGIEGFKASSGWINSTLKRHSIVNINLHGEAMDLTEEERIQLMAPWKRELEDLIDEKNISPGCIYNADQSGFFYQKLPNSLYVTKSSKKDYAGVKQMKDKTRIAIMVCTAADGTRQPIAIIGKPKKPRCFELVPPPLPYKDQTNAWFDKEVTKWWVSSVFWPAHLQRHGNVNCILILDNCSAHNIDYSTFPDRLTVKFLPPNVTSMHQPADMGMIGALKVGYKSNYLKQLLNIFDTPGGYKRARDLGKRQRNGCRGLQYGNKPHILDAMHILKDIWYVRTSDESIKRCWRKAGILPTLWDTDINNDVGSASLSRSSRTISDEECIELCGLIKSLKVKADETGICTTDKDDLLFQNSIIVEGELNVEEMQDMVRMWVDVEDTQEMIDCVVEDELDAIENVQYIIEEEEDDDKEGDVIMKPACSPPRHSVSYADAMKAMDVLDSYGSTCSSASKISKSISSLRWMLQKDHLARPKCSPTITNFFSVKKL